MRNIAVQMYMSLDGVMGAPEKWSFVYWTDDHEKYAYERLLAADALLLGRRTYETFAVAWPEQHDDAFAARMNSITKHVVSSKLDGDLAWNNSFVLGGDVVSEVSKLKEQPGQDILLYGSNELFNTLLDNGLIDDLRLWVFPLVLGQGKRLCHDANTMSNFELDRQHPIHHWSGGALVPPVRTSSARISERLEPTNRITGEAAPGGVGRRARYRSRFRCGGPCRMDVPR